MENYTEISPSEELEQHSHTDSIKPGSKNNLDQAMHQIDCDMEKTDTKVASALTPEQAMENAKEALEAASKVVAQPSESPVGAVPQAPEQHQAQVQTSNNAEQQAHAIHLPYVEDGSHAQQHSGGHSLPEAPLL